MAVIVNEFGDIGVDGEILKGCAIPNCPEENNMALMAVFTASADDFIPTIEKLMSLSPKPEHILIETSGLALPKRPLSNGQPFAPKLQLMALLHLQMLKLFLRVNLRLILQA